MSRPQAVASIVDSSYDQVVVVGTHLRLPFSATRIQPASCIFLTQRRWFIAL
jgi:hypothetical protein